MLTHTVGKWGEAGSISSFGMGGICENDASNIFSGTEGMKTQIKLKSDLQPAKCADLKIIL